MPQRAAECYAFDSPPGEECPVGPRRVARVRKSEVAVLLDVDPCTTEILGWTAEDLVGMRSLDLIHPSDQELAVENWMQMFGASGPGRTVRLRHRHRDGSWLWVDLTNHNLLDDPAHKCVVAEMVDVSDEMANEELTDPPMFTEDADSSSQPLQLHEALAAREQVLHRLAEALPLGVLQLDTKGRIAYANLRLLTILGTPRAATAEEQLSTVMPDDKELVTEALESVLCSGLDNDIEVRIAASDENGDKDIRQCKISLRALAKDTGEVTGAIACVADETESIRMREELRTRATFDEVTGCHNRATTIEALEAMLHASPDRGTQPTVIFIDLDQFKNINDHLGHAAGDQLLQVVANRLRRSVRGQDLVGRIGGDEFLVLCPGISSATEALQAAARMGESLRRPIRLNSAQVACTASIGLSWSAEPTTDTDTLVSHADEAMYEAKRIRSRTPVLYRREGSIECETDSGSERP